MQFHAVHLRLSSAQMYLVSYITIYAYIHIFYTYLYMALRAHMCIGLCGLYALTAVGLLVKILLALAVAVAISGALKANKHKRTGHKHTHKLTYICTNVQIYRGSTLRQTSSKQINACKYRQNTLIRKLHYNTHTNTGTLRW